MTVLVVHQKGMGGLFIEGRESSTQEEWHWRQYVGGEKAVK